MVTKYQNYDCGDSGQVMRPYSPLYDAAQTFTPEVKHSLTQVGMRLRKSGTPPVTYRVRIQETIDHLPGPEILAQGDFESAPITTDLGGEMKIVELDSPCTVEADTEYALRLEPLTAGDVNNTLQWYYKTDTNPYTRGDACKRAGSTTWIQETDCDAGFEEWGEPAITPPTVTTDPATEVT